MTREQSITKLSLAHQILSPYTAFIAVQTENSVNGSAESIVRHVPIQTVQNHETVTQSVPALRYEENACALQANPRDGCQESDFQGIFATLCSAQHDDRFSSQI